MMNFISKETFTHIYKNKKINYNTCFN